MRHRNVGRKLGRKSAPRRALRRHVVTSLFVHGRIETTLAKAKEFRPWAERMVTVAKRAAAARSSGDGRAALNAYRRLVAELHDEAVVVKLIEEIAPKVADRPGGYTRILRVARKRIGDNATTALFELVCHDAESAAADRSASRAARDERRAKRAAAAGA